MHTPRYGCDLYVSIGALHQVRTSLPHPFTSSSVCAVKLNIGIIATTTPAYLGSVQEPWLQLQSAAAAVLLSLFQWRSMQLL